MMSWMDIPASGTGNGSATTLGGGRLGPSDSSLLVGPRRTGVAGEVIAVEPAALRPWQPLDRFALLRWPCLAAMLCAAFCTLLYFLTDFL